MQTYNWPILYLSTGPQHNIWFKSSSVLHFHTVTFSNLPKSAGTQSEVELLLLVSCLNVVSLLVASRIIYKSSGWKKGRQTKRWRVYDKEFECNGFFLLPNRIWAKLYVHFVVTVWVCCSVLGRAFISSSPYFKCHCCLFVCGGSWFISVPPPWLNLK